MKRAHKRFSKLPPVKEKLYRLGIPAKTRHNEVAPGQFEIASTDEHMQYCATLICTLMDEVRLHADALEAEIADEQWPLPKYREMLFIK